MPVKLPGAEELSAPVSGRAGRPIASYDVSAIGRGVSQAGQGLRALSAGLKVREDKAKKEADNATEFDTQARYLQFEDQQRKAFSEAIIKATVGADGFSASQEASYNAAAKEFFKTVPDQLKPVYNDTLFKLQSTIKAKADTFALEERDRVAKDTVSAGQNVIVQGLQDNPQGWRDADAQAEALVRKSGRSPIDQDIDLKAWRKRRSEALWEIDTRTNGGEARTKLGIVDNAGLADSIKAVAADLGVSPNDIATAISYETGGTFDPWKKGPTTQWGQHIGLIQWGEPQRRKYGVTQGMSVAGQVAAVGRYLKDAGVRPGMGLLDIYSAINAGRVGRGGASDANNGGAPGTVTDKVNNQMEPHKQKAAALLGGSYVAEVAPEYADLSYEERIKLYDRSVVEQHQQDAAAAVQQNAQRTAYKEALSLGVETGEVVSQQQILEADIDDGDKATLLKALRAKQNEDGGVSALTANILARSPDAQVNAFDDDQRKIAEKTYDAMQKAVPDEQKGVVTEGFVRSTGYIPQRVQATVRMGAASTNPAALAGAMSQADVLQNIAPTSFEAFAGGSDVRTKLADFRHFVNDLGMSGEQAATEMLRRNDPSVKINRELLKPEADKFLKKLTVGEVTNAFDPGWAASEPGAGIMPEASSVLLAEYRELAENAYYETGGDVGLAKSRALAEIKGRWNVSNISGSANLMRMPPEMHYPAVAGSHEYLRLDAMDTAKEYAKSLDREVQNVAVRATAQTRADIENGRPPRYRLFYQYTDNGQTKFDEVVGGLWGADPSKASGDARSKFMSEHERDATANRAQSVSREQADQLLADPTQPDWLKAMRATTALEQGSMEADRLRMDGKPDGGDKPKADDKKQFGDDPNVQKAARKAVTTTTESGFW